MTPDASSSDPKAATDHFAAISREKFAARPALTPLEADRVAFLAYRILSVANDSLHAYPKCMGLRACLDDAGRIIKLTGRTLTT